MLSESRSVIFPSQSNTFKNLQTTVFLIANSLFQETAQHIFPVAGMPVDAQQPPVHYVPPPVPVKLPPKWKSAKDAEGRTYYYHVKTRISQWEPPPLAVSVPEAAESESSTTSSDDENENDDENDNEDEESDSSEVEEKVIVLHNY